MPAELVLGPGLFVGSWMPVELVLGPGLFAGAGGACPGSGLCRCSCCPEQFSRAAREMGP